MNKKEHAKSVIMLRIYYLVRVFSKDWLDNILIERVVKTKSHSSNIFGYYITFAFRDILNRCLGNTNYAAGAYQTSLFENLKNKL